MRSEGAGRRSRYLRKCQCDCGNEVVVVTHMFVRPAQPAIHLWIRRHPLPIRPLKLALVLNQQPRPHMNRACIVLRIHMLSVHVAAVLAHNIELRVIEHLTEFPKLVFLLALRLPVVGLHAHVLEGLEVGAIFDKTRDVDLRADEVADGAAGVEERGRHEQVHEGGAVAATGAVVRSRYMERWKLGGRTN
jgi:hypothetical protein